MWGERGERGGHRPQGWASAPSAGIIPVGGHQPRARSSSVQKGRKWHAQFTNSSQTCPTHHPIGGLGGNCMVGVRRKEVSPQTSPKYLLQCGSHISLHYLLRITTHPRTFSQSHQLMVVSHCPAPIWPRNNQHTIRKLQPSIPHPAPDRWPRWKISGQSL